MRYRTIVADPPWPYPEGFARGVGGHPHRNGRTPRGKYLHLPLPYASMTLAQIRNLPVRDLSQTDARLFLWTTNRYLPVAFGVVTLWGFTYRQMIVWDKRPNVNPIAGSVAANAAEFLLVGTRGKPERMAIWRSSVIGARKPLTVHSVKPEVFIDFVETVSPGPYVELFSRRHRLGWDVWGEDSANTAQLTIWQT